MFRLLFIMLTAGVLGACSHAPFVEKPILSTTYQSEWHHQVFVSHTDWLGMNLDPFPIDEIRKQLEIMGKVPLKSRGDAHITVVSPPEFTKIKSKLAMNELELTAHQLDIQKTFWKPLCVARAVAANDPKLITYYIVVESPGLQELRREIHRVFIRNGGDPNDFDLLNYHPHITIGFTDRDLFEADGVIKDTRFCSFDLGTAQGEKITTWDL